MQRILFNIIKILCKTFFPHIKESNLIIGNIFKKSWKIYKNNGTLFTVKYLKFARLACTRYYTGQAFSSMKFKISLTKDGFPTIFLDLKPFLDSGELSKVKFAFTLMNLSRTLRPRKEENIPVDLSSITTPFNGVSRKLDLNIIKSCIKELYPRCVNLDELTPESIKLITKAGPNGPQTLSILDTLKNFNYGLMNSVLVLSNDWAIDWFFKLYKFSIQFGSNMNKGSSKSTNCTRKLSIVKDPECKMRVIAIFDYLSQIILDRIGKMLFSILKELPSDRTFTQNPRFSHTTIDRNHSMWSIDLSSATDRFPVDLQVQVLSLLIGKEKAEGWKEMMVGSPFLSPIDQNTLFYSVGQPMGAKSSWPMFTFTHHVCVKYCALSLGINNFCNYIILGDDIVINHDDVAKAYIDLMTYLGVETSPAKTHVSKTTYEFAKRWINLDMGEITGIPLNGIVSNIKNYYIVLSIMFEYIFNKGNTLNYQGTLLFRLASFYNKLMRSENRYKTFNKRIISIPKFINMLTPYYFFMRFNLGITTYDEMRNFISKYVNQCEEYMLPTRNIVLEEFSRVISLGLVGMVWNSVRQIQCIFTQIVSDPNKFGYNTTRVEDKTPLPIVQAIFNHIENLHSLSMKILMNKFDLNQVQEYLLHLDIDAISKSERVTKLSMMMNGKLATSIRRELEFDPLQIESKHRSMSVIAALRATHGQLRTWLNRP